MEWPGWKSFMTHPSKSGSLCSQGTARPLTRQTWPNTEQAVQNWSKDSQGLILSLSFPNLWFHLEQKFLILLVSRRKNEVLDQMIYETNGTQKCCVYTFFLWTARARVGALSLQVWLHWPLTSVQSCKAYNTDLERPSCLEGRGNCPGAIVSICISRAENTGALWSQQEREAIYPLSHPSEASWGVHALGLPTPFLVLILERKSEATLRDKGI